MRLNGLTVRRIARRRHKFQQDKYIITLNQCSHLKAEVFIELMDQLNEVEDQIKTDSSFERLSLLLAEILIDQDPEIKKAYNITMEQWHVALVTAIEHGIRQQEFKIATASSSQDIAWRLIAFVCGLEGIYQLGLKGNSIHLADGASVVLLASEEWRKQMVMEVLAYLTFTETAAVDFVNKKEGLMMAHAYCVPRDNSMKIFPKKRNFWITKVLSVATFKDYDDSDPELPNDYDVMALGAGGMVAFCANSYRAVVRIEASCMDQLPNHIYPHMLHRWFYKKSEFTNDCICLGAQLIAHALRRKGLCSIKKKLAGHQLKLNLAQNNPFIAITR
ncbi:hypothetical protein FQA39_LY18938 [Lamprigera yunnana]|nr:hypothetical protein FQA39_LY18938 [Lamprigera yunnana]